MPPEVNNKTYIIFEAGLNHNGSDELAHSLVRAAADQGADAVKFQKRQIDALASEQMLDWKEERFPSLGSTYRQVREKLELSFETYLSLKSLSHTLNLDFIITPFDEPSFEFVMAVGVDAIKIASHSVGHPRLLQRIRDASMPTYMSSGMSTLEELDNAVGIFEGDDRFVLLHCSSEYPTSHEGANLSLIPWLKSRYGVPVGFSSHENGSLHSLAAVSLGAVALERHVTLDKNLEGFDHKISMDTEEFGSLVREIRDLEIAMGEPKKVISNQEQLTRAKYRVSLVASRDINVGEQLTPEMLDYKNPGTGIPAIEEQNLLGRRLVRPVKYGSLLSREDFS